MSDLRFDGPPPPRRVTPKGHHDAVAKQLRAKPRQWAIIGTYAHGGSSSAVAHQVRRGLIPSYNPAGTFEAQARNVDGEARVYARYVGEDR